jgi:hypothetical protein
MVGGNWCNVPATQGQSSGSVVHCTNAACGRACCYLPPNSSVRSYRHADNGTHSVPLTFNIPAADDLNQLHAANGAMSLLGKNNTLYRTNGRGVAFVSLVCDNNAPRSFDATFV